MSVQGAFPGFNDGKAPDALRTIGEVSAALGIRQHVLRYWEEQFPMLKPVKRSGGRRYYRPEDVQLVIRIDTLVHQQGYTLRGARQAIMNDGGHADALQSASDEVPPRVISRLQSIRDELAAALRAA